MNSEESLFRELGTTSLYALFWRWIALAVHSYGSAPTGQVLCVATMILLDRAGYYPTVTELANITRLPKSSVSRYVAAEMNAGMVEEFIDPHDRRRRRLRPTEAALEARTWHAAKLKDCFDAITSHTLEGSREASDPAAMVRLLTQLNAEMLEEFELSGGKKRDRA